MSLISNTRVHAPNQDGPDSGPGDALTAYEYEYNFVQGVLGPVTF